MSVRSRCAAVLSVLSRRLASLAGGLAGTRAAALSVTNGAQHQRDRADPFAIVSADAMRGIERNLRTHRWQLLAIRSVREVVARERAKRLWDSASLKRVEQTSGAIVHNALDYNLEGARTAPDLDRPSIMTSVVCAIERVHQNAGDMDVLSIGPRSEIEIFALWAAGFRRERIRAIDLFTYSPYVDVGDMHALPYADNSFDIVFVGWVLPYSRDQALACREILRVCRDRAIVVLAGDFNDGTRGGSTFNNELTFVQSCDQLLGYFAGSVRTVYFRHEADPPRVWMVMTVFEVSKQPHSTG